MSAALSSRTATRRHYARHSADYLAPLLFHYSCASAYVSLAEDATSTSNMRNNTFYSPRRRGFFSKYERHMNR